MTPPTENKGETNEEHPVADIPEESTFGEDRTNRTEGSQDGEPTPKRSYRRTSRTELNRWRTRALFDARSGRGLRAFESDILPVRRVHGIQAQLERVASEEAIRAVFTAAIQDETLAEKKTTKGWRPPSDAQINLEKKLTASIKTFIGQSKISKDSIDPPDTDAQDTLRDAIEDALRAANAEGTQIAQGTQESIVSAAKNLADHAKQVVSDIIAQIKERAQSIIDAVLGNADIDPSDVEQEIETQVEEWATSYSEMVAQTEIHTAVEAAVVAEIQNQGHNAIYWNAGPNACDRCKANAAASPIRIDTDFPSGDTVPPAHPRCDCTASEADIDDEE